MKKYIITTGFFIGMLGALMAQVKVGKFTPEMKAEQMAAVKSATVHAWAGYKKFAWGKDDLEPLSKTGKNWYQHPMLMTPVDAFDTFIMLGLTKEANEAKQLILDSLSFNNNNEVQVFEVTIRILGGLITAYELDADPRFLQLATDLANRMLPAFETPTGMPYRYVQLQTGAVRDGINNPAEIGTLMMEFGQLSKHTGNNKYYDVAKKAIMYVFDHRSDINLVGEQIDVNTGKWVQQHSHISGYIDSYYEYLYKCWLLFGDKDFKVAFDLHNDAIKKHLLVKTNNGTFLQSVNMQSGKIVGTTYGALDAFYAGFCAYAGDVPLAEDIQQANYFMWTNFGIEPEQFDFSNNKILSAGYILRPENIESCFYLYRLTNKAEYLWMGKVMLDDILKYCKTPDAFASLKNVQTKEQSNSMQSFFFAETLKYAFLLFAPEASFNFDNAVFNTEAHPFKILNK